LDFSFSEDGLAFIDASQSKLLDNVTVQEQDVLINITGDSVARVCMAPEDFVPSRVNQHVAIVRTDKRVADPYYVMYLLQYLKPHLLSIASVGGTRNALTKQMLENIEINLPTLPEQTNIGNILRALDDKILISSKINHHLEQMAQAIFKSWFVDFKPWGGEMPDDWREGTISDTCSSIYNGGTPRRNEPLFWGGTIPWLTSGEVRQAIVINPANRITEAGLKGSSAKWVSSLSTIVALYGATAGQVSLVATPLTTNQAISSLVPKENHAFYNYLVMRNAVSQLENKAIGSAQQNISKAIVEETPCLIADKATIEEFDKLLSPLFNQWVQNLFESARLAELRDSLLPRLMSGELSVADVDAK
jgi:type I restriction enzyme S subunit